MKKKASATNPTAGVQHATRSIDEVGLERPPCRLAARARARAWARSAGRFTVRALARSQGNRVLRDVRSLPNDGDRLDMGQYAEIEAAGVEQVGMRQL